MRSILRLHLLRQPEQTKLVLKHVQPLFYLKRLFSFFEDWWLGILELFKITILVRFWSLMLIVTLCLMLGQGTHGVPQSTLTSNKHGQQIRWCGSWWRWKIIITTTPNSAQAQIV